MLYLYIFISSKAALFFLLQLIINPLWIREIDYYESKNSFKAFHSYIYDSAIPSFLNNYI